MSTCQNEVLDKICSHKFVQNKEWEPFKRIDSLYISNRLRWSICNNCATMRQLRTEERATYGVKHSLDRIDNLVEELYLDVARLILMGLYKKNNNKCWSTWKKNLLKYYDYQILMGAINILHEFGLLIKQEKRDKGRVSCNWVLTNIRYNEIYIDDIKAFVGIKEDNVVDWLSRPFEVHLDEPQMESSKKIYDILIEQKKQYEETGKSVINGIHGVEVVSSWSSKKGYLKLIRILYGLYENLENKYKVHWRTFSQHVFGNTKEINALDKKRLELVLGKNLAEYGILHERDEVIMYGDFIWALDGFQGNTNSFKDYIALPSKTVNDMKIDNWCAPSILIVENQDLFFSIMELCPLNKKLWAIMFDGGYLSSSSINLIKQASKHNLKNIYVWPDLDPYGYQIALDIVNKVRGLGVIVKLFGYDVHWFQKTGIYKQLELIDIKMIESFLEDERLPQSVYDVLVLMKNNKKKAEQEILINKISDHYLANYIEEESVIL